VRSRFVAIFGVFLASAGCMRSLPRMPSVAVVTGTKASSLEELPSPPAEEADDGDADDPDAEYAVPCKEGSLARHAAQLAYESFGTKVRALAPASDPKPLEEALETLLEHPCFELAQADPKELLTFSSAVSLRQWWQDGGADWLSSYLTVDRDRYLRSAPTPRIALTLETAPKDHPLRPLLCPADESKPCAVDASGWMRRVNEKLALIAESHRSGKDALDCAADAMKEAKADRYAAYRDCLESTFTRQQALPLGRFKAPSDGWLVMNDDSGACRTVRAFHLVTGAVYSATDCRRPMTTTAGRVPVGALREAAWMLFLARESQPNVRLTEGFHVPEKIPIKRARGETIGLGTISCSCGPSFRRSWSWMRESPSGLRGQVSGVFVGRADDDAIRHAFDLLDVATAALESDCAPSPPPARIAWGSPGPASREGEAAVIDDPASEPVRIALAKTKPSRTCTPKP
jgi:hypothetical protein